MRGQPHRQRHSTGRPTALSLLFAIGLAIGLLMPAPPMRAAPPRQNDAPEAGVAQVIAQGVVAMPAADLLWRTVRAQAQPAAEATFAERPLGFVLATAGPVLLVDQESGEQVRLAPGEAALVRAGTIQQRQSLADTPVSYLSLELVPADAPPAADGTVLQPGQPFAAPPGLRDLDLLSGQLSGDEVVALPDTGTKNVLLVTAGAINVARPAGGAATLLAGEAASFDGELQISAATSLGESGNAAFVAALIGPEVPPPPTSSEPPTPVTTAGAATATAAAGSGAIEVQVYTCPPGMTAETIAVAICAPASGDFDVTLSGGSLDAPLTLADASADTGATVWSDLPFGDYLIAEAVLPSGYDTYLLSAETASGDATRGYHLTLGPETARLLVRIYNLAPE